VPDASTLADVVLIVHFAIVLFNVGGLVIVLAGHGRGWRVAHQRAWRLVHLCLVWFVTLETLLGYACPLTVLEDALRSDGADVRDAAAAGFLQRWISRLVFWDLPPWVFGVLYLAFSLAVTATYLRWPPARRVL